VIARAVVLAAAALAAAGCGRAATTGEAPPTAQPAVSPPMTLTVFELRRGLLRPVLVHVPRSRAVAAAALEALGLSAPVRIRAGTATVGRAKATDAEEAEIVYTLTQFRTIRRVDVAGRRGLTRTDFASYVPPIFVETPPPGAAVADAFQVSGTASVFEATLVVQSVRAGRVLERKTVTASEGAPGRGSFDTTLTATPGRLTVQAFAPSAVDGAPQHEVDVEVVVRP
jgi:hypothetical protein